MPTQDELIAALRAADKLFREALPRFNWGASSLTAEALEQLNDTPPLVARVLAEHDAQKAAET